MLHPEFSDSYSTPLCTLNAFVFATAVLSISRSYDNLSIRSAQVSHVKAISSYCVSSLYRVDVKRGLLIYLIVVKMNAL